MCLSTIKIPLIKYCIITPSPTELKNYCRVNKVCMFKMFDGLPCFVSNSKNNECYSIIISYNSTQG